MNQSQNERRFQCLFEFCWSRVCVVKLDNSKTETGEYLNPQTRQFYELWLSGHAQGVADHAVQRGDIEL